MRAFFLSLMTDNQRGLIFMPIKFALYIASLFYGTAIIVRRILYALKIFSSRSAGMKVISVGNLTLGGTGKTPCVIALVEMIKVHLKTEPCVLIRGYGWDEQAMLKKSLSDTPIMVGSDRVKQAGRAVKLYGSGIGILDDGFQYWELKRNLDIVLLDAANPFGNGHLFPRGILREPKSALRRAGLVIFTKIDKVSVDLEKLKQYILRINRSVSFCEAFHRPKHFYDNKSRKELSPSFISGKRVVLVSSIADPSYFFQTVTALGAVVVETMVFNDHHDYGRTDIERIVAKCDQSAFDYIVTTEKDAVKLARRSFSFGIHQLLVLKVELEITSGKEILIDRLHSVCSG